MNVLLAADLMLGAKLKQAAASVGATVTSAPRDGDLLASALAAGAQVAVLDLTGVPEVAQVIRALKANGVWVVGCCGHAELATIEAARGAGIDEVLTKGEADRKLPLLLRAFSDTDPGLAR
jgi:nicotinate-nucleotide pyrophosphorylase